ncbi:unnamed protein product [Closterium sp. NIES-53]
MSEDLLTLTLSPVDAGAGEGSSAIVLREAVLPAKTYANYRNHKRRRDLDGAKQSAPTHATTKQDKQAESPPDMEVENEPIAAAAGYSISTASSEQSVTIPEPFKGWTAKVVKDFRTDFKNYLKAKSKLNKMKTLDSQGVILHSIRTKVVEFQTKYSNIREKSAASVAAIHLENQKRIQADFINSKEMEVEEILAASDSHLTSLAARLEDHIKSLSSVPELAISEVAKEKFRKIKVQCIEKARSEIATAKDDIKVQELLRQKSREAEELKKSAAAEEMTGMETGPTIDEIVRQQVQKAKAEIRKEVKAEFEATLSAKLKAFSLVKQDASTPPAAADSKPKRAKKKRGGKNKKKANTPTNSKEKGPETTPSTSKKAWVPKNGGGGPAKGPLKKK